MTKARTRWPRQRDAEEPTPPDGGTSSLAAVRPTELETCLRACAAHSGKLVAGLDRRRTALAEALRNLLATHATMEQPSSEAASRSRCFGAPAKAGRPPRWSSVTSCSTRCSVSAPRRWTAVTRTS